MYISSYFNGILSSKLSEFRPPFSKIYLMKNAPWFPIQFYAIAQTSTLPFYYQTMGPENRHAWLWISIMHWLELPWKALCKYLINLRKHHQRNHWCCPHIRPKKTGHEGLCANWGKCRRKCVKGDSERPGNVLRRNLHVSMVCGASKGSKPLQSQPSTPSHVWGVHGQRGPLFDSRKQWHESQYLTTPLLGVSSWQASWGWPHSSCRRSSEHHGEISAEGLHPN